MWWPKRPSRASLFVFNRVTGEPIWPVEERPVPMGTGARRLPLADSAFPDSPASFFSSVFHCGGLESVSRCRRDRSPPGPGGERPPTKGCSHLRASGETIQMPGNNGGANWGGGAVDPETGRLYIVSKDHPAILKLVRMHRRRRLLRT